MTVTEAIRRYYPQLRRKNVVGITFLSCDERRQECYRDLVRLRNAGIRAFGARSAVRGRSC